MTAITFDSVTITLADSKILTDITTTIPSGRFIGLVGPNGAGKTTLLRAINGRLTPSTGTVTIGPHTTDALTAREIGHRVATVPQHTTLSFEFTVRDLVEMGRHPHRSRFSVHDPGRDKIDIALEQTETHQFADRSVMTISGGERQRVLLARALAQDTPILLLDEPTANLDINHQIRTLNLVKDLVDQHNKTVIAAIHDLDLAARFCDELFLLDNGTITATGPPETVLTTPALACAFDIDIAVTPNPVTGTPTVTALTNPNSEEAPRVHVLGGGTDTVRVMNDVVSAGYSVSAGPLHENDPAYEAANTLDISTITVPPYSSITRDALRSAHRAVTTADYTVLTNVHIGQTNVELLDIATIAPHLVVIETEPFTERNHAGAHAHETYHRLRNRAYVIQTPAELHPTLTTLRTQSPDTHLPSTH